MTRANFISHANESQGTNIIFWLDLTLDTKHEGNQNEL